MRVLEMPGPGKLEESSRPVPTIGSDGVLVKTESVSICSTDVSYFRGHLSSQTWPIVPGHEMVGQIVEVGRGLKDSFAVGQRVTYWGQTDFDGLAEYRALLPVLAEDRNRGSWFTDRGFHDDHGAAVATIPNDYDARLLSLAEPLTSVMRAVYWNPPAPGDRCLVLGAGPSGLLALQVLQRMFPTALVEIADRNAYRLGVAKQLGATSTIDMTFGAQELFAERSLTSHGDAVDYVFDALPHVDPEPSGQANAPQGAGTVRSFAKTLLRPGGKYVVYGATTVHQSMDTWAILSKGLQISSAPFDVRLFPMSKSASVIALAVHAIGTGTIEAQPLVTHDVSFDDTDGVREIFARYGERNDLKTVITF